MAVSAKDGLSLVPELMDDAVLKTNLLDAPVEGRDNIARVLEILASLYNAEAVAYRKGGQKREYIISNVIAPGGEGLETTTVGLRDDSGWVCAVVMHHEPRKPALALSVQLKSILDSRSRRMNSSEI